VFVAAILVVIGASCGKAIENARAIDPNARCVSRNDDMAYCLIHDQPYICDDDRCLPALCPAAAYPQAEAGNGSKSDR
jgi:hypothetical protein